MKNLRQEFIAFSVEAGVLSFGEFITKAGRTSPYFFNAGLFNEGANLGRLAQFYAQTLLDSGVEFDMLFGPAYKGITLASATAVALAGMGRNVPFAYNRKEAKDHGEGGLIVGRSLAGRVVIVDDVITAGTAIRESMTMIRAAGAQVSGVLLALDRQERGATGAESAVGELRAAGLSVACILTLDDLIAAAAGGLAGLSPATLDALREYRRRYGVAIG